MPMLTRLRGPVLTAAVVATVAVLGAGPAFAATWTVTPGGSVSGSAGTTTLKDSSTGTTVNCSSSTASGSLKSGSGLSNPIGSITSINFNNCTGPLGITFSASVSGPFPLNANSYSSGTTSGTITNVHGTLTSSACSLVIDGTSATAHNGTVNVTFTNSTSTLKVLTTGSTLHIYNVSGCFGLVRNGDGATFSGSYSITPKQTVTSP
ncbi:MAG TPA: hypothetical protein VKS82_21705 [Streptosporangiaceae bacterium]|nr:hypothetical protein [Streptosporangiaceae bacterium]